MISITAIAAFCLGATQAASVVPRQAVSKHDLVCETMG